MRRRRPSTSRRSAATPWSSGMPSPSQSFGFLWLSIIVVMDFYSGVVFVCMIFAITICSPKYFNFSTRFNFLLYCILDFYIRQVIPGWKDFWKTAHCIVVAFICVDKTEPNKAYTYVVVVTLLSESKHHSNCHNTIGVPGSVPKISLHGERLCMRSWRWNPSGIKAKNPS